MLNVSYSGLKSHTIHGGLYCEFTKKVKGTAGSDQGRIDSPKRGHETSRDDKVYKVLLNLAHIKFGHAHFVYMQHFTLHCLYCEHWQLYALSRGSIRDTIQLSRD